MFLLAIPYSTIELKQQQQQRIGWRLGDPHPHIPAHGGLKGYNWLMFLLAIPIIPQI